jgi:vacuolar-type H+-ATPase subunit E/Vma4
LALKVETPADPGIMKSSKPKSVWEYERQYEGIQRTEVEHANKRLEQKAKTLETAESQTKERLEKISDVSTPLSKEVSVYIVYTNVVSVCIIKPHTNVVIVYTNPIQL